MTILILEHSIQEVTESTCEIFQLYFCKNLFNLEEKVALSKMNF